MDKLLLEQQQKKNIVVAAGRTSLCHTLAKDGSGCREWFTEEMITGLESRIGQLARMKVRGRKPRQGQDS